MRHKSARNSTATTDGVRGALKDTARGAVGSVAEGVDKVREAARVAREDGVEATVTGPGGRGAERGAQIGAQIGSVLGTVVEEVARRAAAAGGSLGEGYGTVRERVEAADPAGLVRQVGGALESVVGEGRARAGALVQQPSRVPAVRRRRAGVPEALAASAAGAVAGVAVVLLVRRLLSHDVPGAQEPEQLRAVVDPTPAVEPTVAQVRVATAVVAGADTDSTGPAPTTGPAGT